MKKNNYCAVVLSLALVTCVCTAWAQPPGEHKAPIELYVKGKRFKSVDAYKRFHIQNELDAVFSKMNPQQRDEAIQNIYRDYEVDEMSDLSLSQMREVLSKLDVKESQELHPQIQIEELREIKQWVQNEHALKRQNPSITIDPGKIKTIIVSPKDSAEHSAP